MQRFSFFSFHIKEKKLILESGMKRIFHANKMEEKRWIHGCEDSKFAAECYWNEMQTAGGEIS